MVLLRQFNFALLLSCLSVLAQAEDKQESRQINDNELTKLLPSLTKTLDILTRRITTTPKPHTSHIYRPISEERPPQHYPHYANYPQYAYSLPPHYGPKPEEPTKKPAYKPHPKDSEVSERPHTPKLPHHPLPYPSQNYEHHKAGKPYYPQLPTYGGIYPMPYRPFYLSSPTSGSGHDFPFYIILNPSALDNHKPAFEKPLGTSNTDNSIVEIQDFDIPTGIIPEIGLAITENKEFNTKSAGYKYILENPLYSQNTQEESEGENGEEEENHHDVNVNNITISADSVEENDSDIIDTKDVKLPLDFILAQNRPRKRISDQVALLYLRNYKKGRQLEK